MTTLYIENGVLMTEHGECASAPASAILALTASQSARIAELTEALAALVEHAGRIPNQRTMTTEFMAAYSLARAALKDSK